MPELPEVEVVRRGLADHLTGRRVSDVEVFHPRSVRRQAGGAAELVDRLKDRRLNAVRRRGKYLWIELGDAEAALLAHLGMSGQMLVQPAERPDELHLRIRVRFDDGGPELRFVDQRTFGGLTVTDVMGPEDLPVPVAHIGRDPMDPAFDAEAAVGGLRRRRTGLKRALLDLSLIHI